MFAICNRFTFCLQTTKYQHVSENYALKSTMEQTMSKVRHYHSFIYKWYNEVKDFPPQVVKYWTDDFDTDFDTEFYVKVCLYEQQSC